jgi:hypothetical protein
MVVNCREVGNGEAGEKKRGGEEKQEKFPAPAHDT